MNTFLIAALISFTAVSVAMSAPLDGPAIKKLISGRHVYLSTPYGAELPLYYRTGGSVAGDVSGFSMASMLAPKEDGKWWVTEASLCQKWPTWYKGKTICFTVDQTGPSAIKWVRDDGMKGTARIGD